MQRSDLKDVFVWIAVISVIVAWFVSHVNE